MKRGRCQRPRSLLCAVILLVIGSPARADGVSLDSAEAPRPVAPPETVSLAFVLTNAADEYAEVDLSYSVPEGIRKLSAPERRTVPSGGTRTILVTVFASSAVAHGVQYVVVRAHSVARSVQAEAKLVVRPSVDAELVLPGDGHGTPGERVGYRLQIVNRGNVADDFVLQVRSDWKCCTSRQLVRLPAGGGTEMRLHHYVPDSASPGDQGRMAVTVSTLGGGKPLDTAAVRTTVIPPPPREVQRKLYPVLPGALRWTARLSDQGFLGTVGVEAAGPLGGAGELDVQGSLEMNEGKTYLRRASFVYDRQPLFVHGFLDRTSSSAHSHVLARYRIPGTPHEIGVRWQPEHIQLVLQLLSRRLHARVSCGRAGQAALMAALWSGKTWLEGQLSPEGGAVRLRFRSDAGSVSGGMTWGMQSVLSFGVSISDTTLEVAWASGITNDKPTMEAELSWRAGGRLQPRAGVVWRTDGLEGLHLALRGTVWSSGSWTVRSELQRIEGLSAADAQWSLSTSSQVKVDLCCGMELGVTGELSVPRLGGPVGEVRWRGGVEGGFRLGDAARAQVALDMTRAGTEVESTVTLGASSLFLRVELDAIEFGLQMPAELPFPLRKVQGRVEGVVHIQGSGYGVEGMILKLGGNKALVGGDGVFRFPPLPPGEYELEVVSLPQGVCPAEGPTTVRVRAGAVSEVELVLHGSAEVSGRVVTDTEARSGSPGPVGDERGISGARILLTDGERVHRTYTDCQGSFRVGPICPGVWEVQVKLPQLVPPHRLEREPYHIRLRPGQNTELTLRARPQKRTTLPLESAAP